MNSKDWMKILGVVGLGLTGAGMFGAGPLAGMLGGEAAGVAAGEGLGSSGMFAQIPGVTNGSAQAQALAAQTAEFGGAGANLTAQSAMPGVNAARAAGQMGLPEYAMNVGKADLAGLNDPSVLGQRAMTNLGRMAGGAGKSAGANLAMQGMFGAPTPSAGPAQPRPMPHQPAPAAPQMYGGQGPDVQALIQRAKQGDPQAIAELKRMGVA